MSARLPVSPTSWIHQLRQQQGQEPEPPIRAPLPANPRAYPANAKRGENQDTLIANIGDGTDAINFILVAAGCPAKFRPFVDCVIGLAGDRADWFEAGDLEVGMRARADEEEFSIPGAKKWVQRWRKDFCKWQHKKNLALIECSPGGQDPTDGERYKSRYKVNLLMLAAEAVAEARTDPRWNKSPEHAIEDAAKDVLLRTPETPAYKPRFRAPKRDDDASLNRDIKTALTLLEDAARIKHKRGEDISAFLADFNQRAVKRIEESIARADSVARAVATTAQADKRAAETASRTARTKGVHTNTKDQWTDGEARGGIGEPETAAPLAPVDKSVHRVVHRSNDAEQALEAFASVGVSVFRVLSKDDVAGKVRDVETFDDFSLRRGLPELIAKAQIEARSLIIDVKDNGPRIIQVDEASPEVLELLAPVSFLQVETSEGNGQSWLALPEGTPAEKCAEIIKSLFIRLKPLGANRGASGGLRWPGSINQKPERNQFRVRVLNTTPGRITTPDELEQAGLLPPVPPRSPRSPQDKPKASRAPRTWPDYQRCLTEAKRKDNGQSDRSDADKNWCILARGRGWSEDETAAKLQEVSEKARKRPEYARRTASYAASVIST
jgi:hypothetical protein